MGANCCASEREIQERAADALFPIDDLRSQLAKDAVYVPYWEGATSIFSVQRTLRNAVVRHPLGEHDELPGETVALDAAPIGLFAFAATNPVALLQKQHRKEAQRQQQQPEELLPQPAAVA